MFIFVSHVQHGTQMFKMGLLSHVRDGLKCENSKLTSEKYVDHVFRVIFHVEFRSGLRFHRTISENRRKWQTWDDMGWHGMTWDSVVSFGHLS